MIRKNTSKQELNPIQRKKENQLLRKGRVLTGIDKRNLLREVKYKLTDSQVDEILDHASDEYFDFLIANPIVSKYKELSTVREYFTNGTLIKELNWTYRFLKDYCEEINSFLSLRDLYEKNLLLGEYMQAKSILTNIEDGITKSLWGIQQRLLIAELEHGFQGNKKVLSEILTDDLAPLVYSLVSYSSIRIEKNISISQYSDIVNELVNQISGSLAGYFLMKIDFFRKNESKCLNMLLCLDSTMSIIDRYLAFIQVVQLSHVTNQTNEKERLKIKYLTNDISRYIDDIDLKNINLIDGNIAIGQSDPLFLQMLDEYTIGAYGTALALSKRIIEIKPTCFQSILIYCKCICYLQIKDHYELGNKNSTVFDIISNVVSVLRKDEKFNGKNYSNLYRIAHLLGYHPISVGIYRFLMEFLPYKLLTINGIEFEKLSYLSTRFFNPALYVYIDSKSRERYLDEFTLKGQSPTVELIQKAFNYDKINKNYNVFSLRELKYIALRQKSIGQHEEALQILDYILKSSRFVQDIKFSHLKIELIVAKLDCLISLNKLLEALELSVDTLIEDENYIDHLFNPKLTDKLISSQADTITTNVCLSIFLKVFEGDIDNYHIYVAYDNFLCADGCETPKDFFSKANLSNARHVAFLDKVCRHEVMYSSPFFKDQNELDTARIEICTFLLANSKATSNAEAEVSELFRKVLVRLGVKQIDYSKIYVDIKGVKNIAEKELKDNFLRNIEIAALPADALAKLEDPIEKVYVYYVDGDEKHDLDKGEDIVKSLKFTSYDRFVHFCEAYKKIRDLFLFNSDHGLDTYLSMRIRHGTLPGQIRSVFESHKLITLWSDVDNSYLPNEHIVNKFSISSDDSKSLYLALTEFSYEVDKLAEVLKSQIIQIQTENVNSNGLFNYKYDVSTLLGLFQNKLGSIKEFEVFVDAVLDELWTRTEILLTATRDYLVNNTVKDFNIIFDRLVDRLHKIEGLGDYINESANQELQTIIKDCRTANTIEIQKISEWFKRSNKKYLEVFDFHILLDSSVKALRRSFTGTNINISNSCDLQIDGDYFPYFTDIVFYLLHNALKHSHLPSDNLVINIDVSNTESNILIKAKNNILYEQSYIEYCEARIKEVLQKLEDLRSGQIAFNKEPGGTGFPRIKKTLTQDLNRSDVNFDLKVVVAQDSAWFETIIEFEFDGLTKRI